VVIIRQLSVQWPGGAEGKRRAEDQHEAEERLRAEEEEEEEEHLCGVCLARVLTRCLRIEVQEMWMAADAGCILVLR